MARLFLAVNLPPKLRARLGRIQRLLTKRMDKRIVKWVEEENLHLTLIFLGSVAETKVKSLAEALRRVNRGSEGFVLELSGLGFFPSPQTPRIIWVGVKGEVEKLKKLYRMMASVLNQQGFSFDRRFIPHVTLGRFRGRRKGNQRGISQNELVKISEKIGKFTVSQIDLMESRLTAKGPLYQVRETFKLVIAND